MTDMNEDIFANFVYAKVALRKLAPVPDNFRIFFAGWMGRKPEDWKTMKVTGAEFREAKSGPNKGELCIKVRGSERSVYVDRDEISGISVNDEYQAPLAILDLAWEHGCDSINVTASGAAVGRNGQVEVNLGSATALIERLRLSDPYGQAPFWFSTPNGINVKLRAQRMEAEYSIHLIWQKNSSH